MRITALYPVTLVVLVLAGSAFGSMIFNGNFELGEVGFTTQYTYAEDLTASGTIVIGHDPRWYNPLAASYGDHTSNWGHMLIANGSTGTDVIVWEQTVSVTPNTEYVFSYWLSSWTGDDIRLAEIKCLINGTYVGVGYAPAAVGEWTFIFHRWKSGASTTATIRLIDRDRAQVSNDFAIDDIDMMAIGDNCVLVATSTEGGSVASPGEGVFLYPQGETITLEAKCDPGYEFAGWAGDFLERSHVLWTEMDADHWATAAFKKLDYTVTIKASGSTPDEFSACEGFTDRLSIVCGALESGSRGGMLLGQRKGICSATYRFPIFNSQAGMKDITRIAVNVYGNTLTAGSQVWVGDAGPYRAQSGDVHQTFSGGAVRTVLAESKEPLYWLPVTVNASMGAWDLAAVYVSYDCTSVPPSLLRRFHDHFSIFQALDHYAQDQGIRNLFDLLANEGGVWEGIVQTVARAEDLAGSSGALASAVGARIDALPALLGQWQLLRDSADLTPLAGCHTRAIVTCLDQAVASGQPYVSAYAEAIADGRVSPEEAKSLNRRMADWKLDLVALESALTASFDQLGDIHRRAKMPKEQTLRDTAEKLIRAMTPWCAGEPSWEDFGLWIPSRPTYLEEIIRTLEDFPSEDISAP
jgi:hypothetical protein